MELFMTDIGLNILRWSIINYLQLRAWIGTGYDFNVNFVAEKIRHNSNWQTVHKRWCRMTTMSTYDRQFMITSSAFMPNEPINGNILLISTICNIQNNFYTLPFKFLNFIWYLWAYVVRFVHIDTEFLASHWKYIKMIGRAWIGVFVVKSKTSSLETKFLQQVEHKLLPK